MTERTAYDWIDHIERMQSGPNGPTIRLRACVLEIEAKAERLEKDADNCAAQNDGLRAANRSMRAELQWYADGAYAMSCNVLAHDKAAVMNTMQQFALDGGARAKPFLGPNVGAERQ